ncbi:MAG: hypothetical protein KGZ93_04670 [Actinobacteria bacterium]|nr:hypothetical protein [Actinomycetota bacterium]
MKVQITLEKKLNEWMLYALLSIAFIIPLAISRPLLMMHDQFDLPKLLILRILILAALLILARKIQVSKKLEFRWSNIDFALIGFLALALASAAASFTCRPRFTAGMSAMRGSLLC